MTTETADEPQFVEIGGSRGEAEAGPPTSAVVPKKNGRTTKRNRLLPQFALAPAKPVDDVEELSWQDKTWRWILSASAIAYASSFLVHAIILLVTSLLVVQGIRGNDSLGTMLSGGGDGGGGGDDTDLGGPEGTDLGTLEDESIVLKTDMPAVTELLPAVSEREAVPLRDLSGIANGTGGGEGGGEGNGSGGGQGDGTGSGSGFKFRMPGNGRAVSKGSFTAWTVPEDPDPGQNYMIVIQIQLPPSVKEYSSRDLSGRVVGTDRYLQPIPGPKAPEQLPLKDNQTQLAIEVPGAERLVRDTIIIESRRLKERQTLEIVF